MNKIGQIRHILETRLEALRNNRHRSRRGMTLMEVMIVIAIILLLMGALTFGLSSMFAEAQGDTAALSISRINDRVRIFQVKKRKVPSSLRDIYKDDPIPVDPWGNEFVLRNSGGKNGYDIISFGADGKEGGDGANADIKLSDIE